MKKSHRADEVNAASGDEGQWIRYFLDGRESYFRTASDFEQRCCVAEENLIRRAMAGGW